jgi:hypothetical protein
MPPRLPGALGSHATAIVVLRQPLPGGGRVRPRALTAQREVCGAASRMSVGICEFPSGRRYRVCSGDGVLWGWGHRLREELLVDGWGGA